ncbi:MAG: zinc ABC transporter substrate-binding protein, partial [Atopobium sp.]|nr:zinc ABC transporter substrate-binding protein [Atopobium sp.]
MKHLSARAPLGLRAYITSAANSTSSVRSSAPACSPSATRTGVAQRSSTLTRRSALTLLGASSAATIAFLAACSPRDSAANSSSAQNQNSSAPLVLTTFTVIQDMASRVAGEFCQVESITKAGAEIHDYEPTPDDLKRAQ